MRYEVTQMPDAFAEFKAACDREWDVDAGVLDLIKGLHLILVNVTDTLDSLGKEVRGQLNETGSGRHELTGEEITTIGTKELEK